jgi:hypothetical protein
MLNSLRDAISEERNKAIGIMDRIMVLTGYRSVWKSDELVRPEWDIRVARIHQISDGDLAQWQKDLSAVEGGSVSDLWTYALVSDLAEVFPGEKFDSSRSATVRARLPLVPRETIQTLADSLKMPNAYAAVLIVGNAGFFDGSGFRQSTFDSAVRSLASRLQSSK